MAGGHSHDPGDLGPVSVAGRSQVLLLAFLALAAVATVIGVFQLWPDSRPLPGLGATCSLLPRE
jgi:hypothetical protein